MSRKTAFSIIELAVILAIIALLTIIALPNFVDSQTRTSVSRAKAEMRSLATALESYRIGQPNPSIQYYPDCHTFGASMSYMSDGPILERLSTPVAYISNSSLRDPFPVRYRISVANAASISSATLIAAVTGDANFDYNCYYYQSWNGSTRTALNSIPPYPTTATAWLLHSSGPDKAYYNLGGILATDDISQLPYTMQMIYDPTNGLSSPGSIWRTGGGANPTAPFKAGEGLVAAIRRGY